MKENDSLYYGIVPKENIHYIPKEITSLDISRDSQLGFSVVYYFLQKLHIRFGTLDKQEGGKPFFQEGHIHFNYAHSKNFIACAIGNMAVGIDIEEKSRCISDITAKKALSSEASPKERVRQWVHKEAYAKLDGKGLGINLKKLHLKDIQKFGYEIEGETYWAAIYTHRENPTFEQLDYVENV